MKPLTNADVLRKQKEIEELQSQQQKLQAELDFQQSTNSPVLKQRIDTLEQNTFTAIESLMFIIEHYFKTGEFAEIILMQMKRAMGKISKDEYEAYENQLTNNNDEDDDEDE